MTTAADHLTPHESAARSAYARLAGRPVQHYRVVHRPEIEMWYDWYDVDTRKGGQCRMGVDGRWVQEPRGKQPVILAYKGR
jgi:hypothetical protein